MDLFGIVDISLWIPLTILCISLLYIYGAYPMKTWSRLGVSGPPSLPLIGNMHQMMDRKVGSRTLMAEWEKTYGKVYGIQWFRRPCLVVTDIELVNQVLVKNFNSYHDRFSTGGKTLMPQPVLGGLAFETGYAWKRLRRIMTPTFTSGKLKMLTGYMNTTARQLTSKLQEHVEQESQPVAKTVFGAFGLDVIAGTAFGLDLDTQHEKDGEFFKKVEAIFKVKSTLKLAIAMTGIFPFMGHLFKMLNISTFNPDSVDYMYNLLGKLVTERKDNREQFKETDFFQLLLDAEMDDDEGGTVKRKLTKNEIACQGITFIMAGYETSSTTLQYVIHVLANNHPVQDRLIEEIRRVVTCPDLEVSYDTCQELKYMDAVIRETLRMYPPIVQLRREATENTTLNGTPVPKGAGIIIPLYNLGRDPELFEDPNTFNPDRFTDNDSVKPIQFLPFGFGPRQCIGMRMAMVEMKIALVHMLSKVYILEAHPKEMELEDYTGFLAPKQPFRLTLKLH